MNLHSESCFLEKEWKNMCVVYAFLKFHSYCMVPILWILFFLPFLSLLFLSSFLPSFCLPGLNIHHTERLSSMLYLPRTPAEILTLWRRRCWIFQSHFTGTNIESQQDWISCHNSHISLTVKSGPTPKDFWFSIQHSFQYQQKIVLEPITTWFVKSNHRGKTMNWRQ